MGAESFLDLSVEYRLGSGENGEKLDSVCARFCRNPISPGFLASPAGGEYLSNENGALPPSWEVVVPVCSSGARFPLANGLTGMASRLRLSKPAAVGFF